MVSIGGGGADLQDRGLALLVDGDNGSAQNLLSGPCPAPGQERSDRLLGPGQLRLELIHSCEFANPPGFWYDQSESEWVLLLQGGALLRFADEAQARSLKAGDSLLITPGRRHRVEATDPAPGTRWLALFW
jgi:cupin 2 domain-containing protein